jgi:predicted Zn finger-like uncharacterized protein
MHSMFTVCPKCTLTLAVTADDLRAGQGYVRCGRCLNVFNALLALSEQPGESEVDEATVYSQADPVSSSQVSRALASGAHAAVPPDAPSLSISDSQRARLPTERSADGAIESESTAADGTASFETIVLEGEGITQTEEFAPQEAVDSEIAALAGRLADESDQSVSANDDDATAAQPDTGLAVEEAAAVEIIELATPPRHFWRWAIGACLLALLLAAQGINHWRDALASRPALNAALTKLYARFGLSLDPHWDLAAYEIRQQGAASDPGDSHVIHVRLSLANHALRAQPVPLVRLTLLDRYGKRLAARDLTPAEYWPRGQSPRSFLGHDERIDSEVQVRDPPGADSANFEIDVCLASVRGAIHCQGDLSTPGSS